MTKTNTYKTNKQTHKKHTNQLPLPQAGDHNEAPRSINHKATQSKNNTGSTALEWTVA